MIIHRDTKKVQIEGRGCVDTYTLVNPIQLGQWDGFQALWAEVEEYDQQGEAGLCVVCDDEFTQYTDLYLAICRFGSYGIYNLVYSQEHAMDIPVLKTFAFTTYDNWGIE